MLHGAITARSCAARYAVGMETLFAMPFVPLPLPAGLPPSIVLPLGDAAGLAVMLLVALLGCVAALVAQTRRRDSARRAMPGATPRRLPGTAPARA